MERKEQGREEDRAITRRGLLKWGTRAGFFLSALEMWRILRAYFSPAPAKPEAPFLLLGKWDDLQKIDLLQKGGIYLIRDAGGFYALRGECTHLGCRVHWTPSRNRFECPCHGSLYDRKGGVLSGPTQKPLIRVFLKRNPAGEVIADLTKKAPPGFRLQKG